MSKSLKYILKISTVLYIDSYNENVAKIEKILTLFFKKVVFLNNYEDAYNYYIENKPAAIITEVLLDDKSGIELIKKIREKDNKTPIMIVSFNKDEKNLFDAIRLNLVDYLVKPINSDDLIYALNNIAKKIFNNGNIMVYINKKLSYSYLEKTLISNDEKIMLTKNEIKLIELLIANKDKTVTKEDIEYHIWKDEVVSESAFKSLFLRLRNKIGKNTIVNNFGIGYTISLNE